jgi:Glycosyltransferase
MSRPIKIIHVVHSLEPGGLENGVVNLLNRLESKQFDHTLCCLARGGDFTRRLTGTNVKIVELGCGSTGFRFPLMKLGKFFRSLKADVVHTRGWGTIDAVFAALLARVPVVIHSEHGREWADAEGRNWKRNQIRRAIGLMANRYVVVCAYFDRWLRETCKVPADKIVHIPNGVDTHKFFPLPAVGAAYSVSGLRERLGLPADGILIGSVGRLDLVKDYPTLLKAFAALRSELPNLRLAIAGDGPQCFELRALAENLGISSRVSWLGLRSDTPELFRAFDIFVQPSLFEGMSNTILEAMATGLPVVATDAGGNSELVVDRVNGRLFPVGDVVALCEILRGYILDPILRDTHARESRNRAFQQFELSLMTGRYKLLYEELVVPTR